MAITGDQFDFLLGYISTGFFAIALLPQIVHVLRVKDTAGLSLLYLLLNLLSALFGFLYGARLGLWPTMLSTGMVLSCCIGICGLKLKDCKVFQRIANAGYYEYIENDVNQDVTVWWQRKNRESLSAYKTLRPGEKAEQQFFESRGHQACFRYDAGDVQYCLDIACPRFVDQTTKQCSHLYVQNIIDKGHKLKFKDKGRISAEHGGVGAMPARKKFFKGGRHGAQVELLAGGWHDSSAEYPIPGLFAVVFFSLTLISFYSFHGCWRLAARPQDPLMLA